MKHVADQRKRKRWLVPLALCLAVCLAIHPVGLNAVQAEEDVEEDAVSAFWAAADAFWGDENGKQQAFWEASDALWGKYDDDGNVEMTGAMDEYWEAEDDTEAKDAARKKVQDAIAAYKAAYAEVKSAFDNVTAKYNALPEEEKTAKDEEDPDAVSIKDIYTMIDKLYNGDDTGEFMSMEVIYQDSCIEIDRWNYWDNEFQYGDACAGFGSASEALWGSAIPAYNEARDTNGDMDAAREAVLEAADGVKDAYALIGKFYDAMKEAYENEKIPADRKVDLEESYTGATENKLNLDQDYEGFLKEINIWKYTSSNDGYGKARDLFLESTNNFQGNEQENIAGAYPTYMAALESEAEELDALYEEVLAVRAAVEEAYETMTVKYQAAGAAYAALTEAEQQAPYGEDNTVADIHEGIVNDYTTGYVPETYNSIHECEIPAPVRDSKILEYISSNDGYGTARDLFWESTNNFLGNEQENIAGAHPTYMAALESEAEELDALYEEVLAARTAVEEAYEAMTVKYQAANAAYAALNEAEQQAPYGDDNTVAGIHEDIVDDYTTGWVPETYNLIHECEIPAPPQKEEPLPTPVPTTPPREDPVATPTPVPTTPSGQGSAAQSAPVQEPLADWNVVYKNVENSVISGKAQNIYAQVGTKFQVTGNVLDKLAGSRTALFLNTGTGLSFSISGVDVPQGVSSLKVGMAATDGIPEAAKQSVLTDATFSRAFAMEDKSAYPIKIDVHLNVGKENAGKNAYLYYYDEITGKMKLAGSFKATEAGQVMFAINHGDEYIVVVANSAAAQHGSYTVVPGDTLSRIAARNGMSLKQLLQANPGIKNPNKIHPGDVINLN